MATAITAVFGANSTQFQAELVKMQTMAASSAARIKSSTAIGGGHVGMTGMVRETAVIGREIAMERGMGRILASLTLLTQYIGVSSRAAKASKNAASELSEAYERQALKADVAAIAALRKSQALTIEAEMEGFENDATLVAADANAKEADTARLAAASLREKAASAAADAAAQDALAGSSATAGLGMMGLIAVFGLMVIIIAEAYAVFKGLSEILSRTSKIQLEAAEYANKHKLAIWEEIEALEKLKDASEKTTEAIRKMNEAKDRSVELAREAVEASNNESDAKEKLYDANTKSKILDIDALEKRGLIGKLQAARKKAEIESQAVSDKAVMKQEKMDSESNILSASAKKADADKIASQKAVQAASDKINKSPEGIAKAKALANAEKDLSASKSEAEQAKKDLIEYNKGGVNFLWSSSLKARMDGFRGTKDKEGALKEQAETKANAAASAEIRVNALKRFMSPDEKALAEAERIANERSSSSITLHEQSRKANMEADINRKNSPAEVAAEQKNIKKEAEVSAINADRKGFSLNSQQKIGAYASTPPEWKQQVDLLRQITINTAKAKAHMNNPPGVKPVQMGTKPTGIHGGVDYGQNY